MKGKFLRTAAAVLALALLLCACRSGNSHEVSSVPSPSPTPSAAASPSPSPEASVPQSEPPQEESSVPSPESTPAPTPTPAAETLPPSPVPTPPSTPKPLPSPSLMPTPEPTPDVSSPQPTQTVPPLSPIEQIAAEAVDKRHLQLSETPLTGEEEANRYFYDMAAGNYVDFGVFVTEPVFAHTAEEYIALFPGLDSASLTKATAYSNGYYFRYKITRNANFALKTAVMTGNTSYLTDTEQTAYTVLFDAIGANISPDMSTAAQVMAVHDYIVLRTVYSGSGPHPYDAVGVLVDGSAVCDGYSKAFQLFMDALGIPSVRLTGTAGGANHAWNAVQIDGSWYQLDVTWDDPLPDTPGVASYAYFLITDDMMMQDHAWSYSPVTCSDTSLLLFPFGDCVVTSLDAMKETYAAQKEAGKSHITLVYPTASFGSDESIAQFLGVSSYYPSYPRGEWSVLVVRG